MYNYFKEVKKDVEKALERKEYKECIECFKDNRSRLKEALEDKMFNDVNITGNDDKIGAYLDSEELAKEYLCNNMKLLVEALEYNCLSLDFMIDNGFVACDVVVRCYVLDIAIEEALNEKIYKTIDN